MKTIKIKTESGWKEIEVSDESYENIEKEVKPEFKVGDWYRWGGEIFRVKNINGNIFYITEIYDSHTAYVYTYFHNPSDIYSQATKATPEEIKEHLEAERIKRGYKKGAKVRCVKYGSKKKSNTLTEEEHHTGYYEKDDEFWMVVEGDVRVCIYKQGKWAEIVEDDTIMIGNYEVKVFSDMVQVGCQPVKFETVKKIYQQMKKLRRK